MKENAQKMSFPEKNAFKNAPKNKYLKFRPARKCLQTINSQFSLRQKMPNNKIIEILHPPEKKLKKSHISNDHVSDL